MAPSSSVMPVNRAATAGRASRFTGQKSLRVAGEVCSRSRYAPHADVMSLAETAKQDSRRQHQALLLSSCSLCISHAGSAPLHCDPLSLTASASSGRVRTLHSVKCRTASFKARVQPPSHRPLRHAFGRVIPRRLSLRARAPLFGVPHSSPTRALRLPSS
jgi:hypothetical protein